MAQLVTFGDTVRSDWLRRFGLPVFSGNTFFSENIFSSKIFQTSFEIQILAISSAVVLI